MNNPHFLPFTAMSIRKYTYPRDIDLSPGLQDVLRKNGMRAHISAGENGPQLIVQGHDSPTLRYNLTEKQVENLMGWGSTYENKKAYNTFTSIVKNDFHMPQNFVSASNAFGRVAMGLHGYRLGEGEYGYSRRGIPFFAPFHRQTRGWGGDYAGWAPRHEGFHLRRIGNQVYGGGGPVVAERPDGRIKPGELKSGGYGFYYKGRQQETSVDVLDRLSVETKIKPLEAAARPQGQGIPYSERIWEGQTNGFTNDKFQEVLKSHGIAIDAQKGTLTIQSNLSKVDLQYDLKPEEIKKLTANSLSGTDGVSLNDRLAIINNVIKVDFATPLTKDMLETKELVSLDLKPEVRAEVEAPFIEQERRIAEQQRRMEEQARTRMEAERIRMDPNAINGAEIREILGNKGFYQPVSHGREMVIGEIRVDKTAAGAFVMTAEINGRLLAHTISEKQYDKFLDLDDKHRLKMFDDIFKEVEIKSANGKRYGDDMYVVRDGQTKAVGNINDIEHAKSNSVDGAALQAFNEKKGFYRERAHGREVEVGDIRVERDPQQEGKYKMTAVINGQSISHEISQKQYDKFMAVDDYQRMKLFSKVFDEVDMKTRPGQGVNIGAAILAALVTAKDVLTDGLAMGAPGPGPRPEIYESRIGPVYHKPGVVSPADVAAANYRSMEANMGPEPGLGMGRGM